MKNSIISKINALALTMLIAGTVSAQDANDFKRGEIGIRIMPTFSKLDVQGADGNVIKGSVKVNPGFGVFVGFNFTKHIGIQGEVDYVQENQKYTDRQKEQKLTLTYIDIPLLLTVNTNKAMRVNFKVVAGPQIGFNLKSDLNSGTTSGADTVTAVVQIKKGDFGLAYGAGLEVALNEAKNLRLDLGFRGFYGLIKTNKDESVNSNGNTYNVILNSTRKYTALYLGVAFSF